MKAGWKDETLGGIFEIGSSKRVLQKQWQREGVPFYRAREIVKLAKEGSVENDLFISEDHFAELKDKHGVPSSGDLMVSAVGTLGACYVVQPDDRFYFKDASVLRFHPKVDVDSRFYQYAFQWNGLLDTVKKSDGATVGTLTISRAKDIPVPLPPLEEQERIVAVLDKAFESLARARAHAEANLQNAQELLANLINTIMDAAGADNLRPLGELCRFENGDRGKNYPGRKAFVPEGVPFINAGHLLNGPIDWSNMNYIPEEHYHRLSNGKVKRGDLLFCLRGSLGKFGVVDSDGAGAIASSLVIVRPSEKLLGAYLSAYFESKSCADMIDEYAGGAAQPNLSAKSLAAFKIALPSLEEQNRVVRSIAETRKLVNVLILEYGTKLQNLDDLRQSLLQKAFAGELT